MIISDEQIKMIANSIVYDVRHYIMEHQTEYQEFLNEESTTTQNSEQTSLKGGDILDENEFKKNQGDSKLKAKGSSIESTYGCGET